MSVEVAGKLQRGIEMMDKAVATTEGVVRDDPLQASYASSLVKRYNNAARAKLRAGDVAGARGDSGKALSVLERLVANDPRDSGSASMLVSSLATASQVEHQGGRPEKAIELARASIAADARLPPELRKGLIVRENVVGAKRTLAAAACALPRPAAGRASRLALLAEARTLLQESRAFKQELVQRGIDGREAAEAIREIEADLRLCDQAIARLG
jgi:eukaryotic-like serine/threonine-protein kinase